jgi:hypothetical protein
LDGEPTVVWLPAGTDYSCRTRKGLYRIEMNNEASGGYLGFHGIEVVTELRWSG